VNLEHERVGVAVFNHAFEIPKIIVVILFGGFFVLPICLPQFDK
jgi:hypothetical protein